MGCLPKQAQTQEMQTQDTQQCHKIYIEYKRKLCDQRVATTNFVEYDKNTLAK